MSSNEILIADENPSSKILIIENNRSDLKLLQDYLANSNYEIETAIDGLDIQDKVNTFHPNIILISVDIQDFDSIEFCK
jgi:DNA-binding response OmpR family regulator